jgi:hypothetical protein
MNRRVALLMLVVWMAVPWGASAQSSLPGGSRKTPTAVPIATSTAAAIHRPPVTQAARTKASSAELYVVSNATSLLAVQIGFATWDGVLALSDIFTPNWNGTAVQLLDILGNSAGIFVAPPANTDAFNAFDAKLTGQLSTLTNDVVPAFRAAIATKKKSEVDKEMPAWSGLKTSFAALAPELYQLPTYAPGEPVTHTISGTLLLTDTTGGNFSTGQQCAGSGGYNDLSVGANVVVRNEADTIIATGSIIGSIAQSTSECALSFLAVGVPEAKFYSLVIGHRTGPAYSAADLAANHWALALSIGS